MNEEKTLEAVRLELGEYFGHGAIFYDWEKEFGVLNTSITRTVEETIAYYKKVEDVIKAVLKTPSLPEDAEHNSYVKGEEFNKILNSLPLDKIIK